ncbi:MAG: rhomboid family intramembrane serine protease [Candidatus Melainabacteria bacterium]|nr:rhomboid family intramembrane serine protease [Candidatus Melainabacteria bacterium]
MTSQFSLWLYPLLAFSVVALAVRARIPFGWSWGSIIQVLPVLACGVLGLYVGPDWVFAIVGWLLLLVFYLPSRFFYTGIQRNLMTLNAGGMMLLSERVKLIFWGLPGRFWSDMTRALALYIEGRGDDADALLDDWQGRQGLPKDVRDLPSNYRFVGNGVMWRWQRVVDQYEAMGEDDRKRLGHSVLLPTARAYAELGRFDDAAECIKKAKLAENMLPMQYLALSLLPFFSLSGAISELKALIGILAKKSKDFPVSSREYWTGRCYLAAGQESEARKCLEASRNASESERFKSRIDWLLESRVDRSEKHGLVSGGDVRARVDEIWQLFRKAAYVQEIISPQRQSVAVTLIVVLIVLVYLLYGPIKDYMVFFKPVAGEERLWAWVTFVVSSFSVSKAAILHGEYYRLLTYLFLHAHVTHMILNIVGLVWFGRIAENIFGTSRFVAIYFVGGILSGVAHSLLSTDIAVGASGAVMAVFAASAAGIYRLKDKIPDSVRRFELSWLGGLAAFQVVLDQVIPHVAAFAHLGGLLAGLAFGMVLSLRNPDSGEEEITGKFVGG